MNFSDWTEFEIKPQRLDSFPLDWEQIFRRTAPLAVEIGFGNGEFLAHWVLDNPEWNFVGIELSMESMLKMFNLIRKNKLTNVRLIRDEASFILRELFADNSLHYVMMNFPDPWPKARHSDRRTIKPSFVRTLSAVLETGGTYELVTDQGWYSEGAHQYFSEAGAFEIQAYGKDPIRNSSTKYERKWLQEKRDIFGLRVKKRKSLAVKRLLGKSSMPHYVLSQPVNKKQVTGLSGMIKTLPEGVIKISDIFWDESKSTFLLRAVSNDEQYIQNFFILIAPHDNGYIVKLDPGFQPYRTPAVKSAIRIVGEFLQNT